MCATRCLKSNGGEDLRRLVVAATGSKLRALTAAEYQVFAINPLAAARYRDRHHVSGAKSDPSDAKMLADLVRTDRHNHRPIAGDTSAVEAVKVLARAHQNLIWARTRHTNSLRSALREYYPAALEAFEDLTDRDALAILGRAPTPADARRLSLAALRSKPLGDNATSTPERCRFRNGCAPSSSPLRPSSPPRSGRHPGCGRHHRRTEPPDRRSGNRTRDTS
jgi:transposase